MSRILIAVVLAILAAAGSTYALLPKTPQSAAASSALAAADPDPAFPAPHILEWEGSLRAGIADRLAHTRETERVAAPLARMGFLADIPEGTTRISMRLIWQGAATMHVMTHGPHEAGMPTFMAKESEAGESCLVVPAEDVLAGTWSIMAHGDDHARDIAFRILIETQGPAPAVVREGDHGHSLVGDMPMDHKDALACEA